LLQDFQQKKKNEKLKQFSEEFLLENQNGFRKGSSHIETYAKLVEKMKEFNLKTHLALTDYEVSDKVEVQNLFCTSVTYL
jgi:hypothetical protein